MPSNIEPGWRGTEWLEWHISVLEHGELFAGENKEALEWYQQAELQNGRW